MEQSNPRPRETAYSKSPRQGEIVIFLESLSLPGSKVGLIMGEISLRQKTEMKKWP